MDLYREAQQYPGTLQGRATVARTAQLPLTKSAAGWRTSHNQGVARPYRGYYLLGSAPTDLLDRCRATIAVASPRAVIGFDSAAALLGFGITDSDVIHLVVPAGEPFPQRRGIAVHQSVVPIRDPVEVAGVVCTGGARTAIDLARALPRAQALSVLDAALSCGACTADDLAAEVRLHHGLKGYRRALELVPLADGRSQCAQETHLRLILRDAGLVSFEPQLPVWDSGDWPRYFLDLADARLRVCAEYDGSSHLDRRRLREDRARHNFLSTRHWRVRYFTDFDIYRAQSGVVRTIRAAIADALTDHRAGLI